VSNNATVPESPEILRQRASELTSEAIRAAMEPATLHLEAARLRAMATALDHRATASAELATAERAADAATYDYEATAAPEQTSAARSTEAQQLAQAAADKYEQAKLNGATPAALIELRMRLTAAIEVNEHEAGAHAAAQAARKGTRDVMHAAENRVRQARRKVAEADAAVADPAMPARTIGERCIELIFTWPVRVLMAGSHGYPPLGPEDRVVCQALAGLLADELGVMSPHMAAQIDRRVGDEARRLIARVQVVPGDGAAPVSLGSIF